MDWEGVLETVGGNRNRLRELVDVARQEVPDLLSQLNDAITAQDARTIQRIACTIKGDANILLAAEMAQVAAAIQESAQRNDLNSASRPMSRLRELVDQFVHECGEFLAKQ